MPASSGSDEMQPKTARDICQFDDFGSMKISDRREMLGSVLEAVLRKVQAHLDASASPRLMLGGALSRSGKADTGSASAIAGMLSHKESKF